MTARLVLACSSESGAGDLNAGSGRPCTGSVTSPGEIYTGMALVGGYLRRAGDDSSKSYIERLLDIASDEAKNYTLTATAEVAVVVFLLKDLYNR
jgi:hypothetical protein